MSPNVQGTFTKSDLRAAFRKSVAPLLRLLETKVRDAVPRGSLLPLEEDDIRNIACWIAGRIQFLRDLALVTPSEYADLLSTLNRMSIELHAQRGRGPRPEMALEEVQLLKQDIERL